jgi:hypothetical protein
VANSLDGLFKTIEVRTYVELGGVQDVFVIRRMVPWDDDVLYGPEDRTLLDPMADMRADAVRAQSGRPADAGPPGPRGD